MQEQPGHLSANVGVSGLLHAEYNLSLQDIHMTLTSVQFAVCGEKKRSIFWNIFLSKLLKLSKLLDTYKVAIHGL